MRQWIFNCDSSYTIPFRYLCSRHLYTLIRSVVFTNFLRLAFGMSSIDSFFFTQGWEGLCTLRLYIVLLVVNARDEEVGIELEPEQQMQPWGRLISNTVQFIDVDLNKYISKEHEHLFCKFLELENYGKTIGGSGKNIKTCFRSGLAF